MSKDIKKDMESWYEERTRKHIAMVSKYCKKLANHDGKYSELIERSKIHDKSKFEEPEKTPYVYITWKYKCKDDGMDFEDCDPPEDMDDKMFEATLHHIKNNRHHPEYHTEKVSLNQEDRDKPPDEMVDGTKMNDIDIAEMCCDWCAVSQEKGGTPQSWADKNVNVRWEFTERQKDLIYHLLDVLWE